MTDKQRKGNSSNEPTAKRETKVKFNLNKLETSDDVSTDKKQEKDIQKPIKGLLKKPKTDNSNVNSIKNGISNKNELNGNENPKKRKLQLDLDASDGENSEDDIANHIFSDDDDEEDEGDFEQINGEENEEEDEDEDDEDNEDEDNEDEDDEEDEEDDEKTVKISKRLREDQEENDDFDEEEDNEERDEIANEEDDVKINLAYGNSESEDLQIIHQRIHDVIQILNDFQNRKQENK